MDEPKKKRRKPMRTSALTKKLFEEKNYTWGWVERWIAAARKRKDLFGFIDAVVMGHGYIIGIQVTSASGRAEHRRKVEAEANSSEWLLSNARFMLVCWRRGKLKRGGKKIVYKHDIEELTINPTNGKMIWEVVDSETL